jgi:hypothetical protein
MGGPGQPTSGVSPLSGCGGPIVCQEAAMCNLYPVRIWLEYLILNDKLIYLMVNMFYLVFVSSDASPLLGLFASSDCRCRSYIGRDFFQRKRNREPDTINVTKTSFQ